MEGIRFVRRTSCSVNGRLSSNKGVVTTLRVVVEVQDVPFKVLTCVNCLRIRENFFVEVPGVPERHIFGLRCHDGHMFMIPVLP